MNVNPFSYLIEKLKGKVDKSGDTMTGTLNIEATTDTPLTLKRTNSSSSVMLNFYNQNGIVGGYVAGNDGKPYYRKSDGTYPQIALTSDLDTVVKSVFQGVTSSSITIKNLQNGDMIIIGRNGLMMGIIVHDGLVNLLTPSALTDFSYSSGTLTFTRTSPYSSEIIVNYRNTVGRSTPTITG